MPYTWHVHKNDNLQVSSRKVEDSSDEEIGVKIPKDEDDSEEER